MYTRNFFNMSGLGRAQGGLMPSREIGTVDFVGGNGHSVCQAVLEDECLPNGRITVNICLRTRKETNRRDQAENDVIDVFFRPRRFAFIFNRTVEISKSLRIALEGGQGLDLTVRCDVGPDAILSVDLDAWVELPEWAMWVKMPDWSDSIDRLSKP